MKRIFTSILFAIIAITSLMVAACSSPGSPPTAAQVLQIQNACAIDAGIRPTVSLLLAVPNLASAQEVAAVTAARAVIDPICANPTATLQSDALTAFTVAATQVIGIETALEARKAQAESKPIATVAPAASQ